MNTIPQTEREVVDSEVGILSRDFYASQLDTLNFNELKAECLKQYDLSGLSLEKYRIEYQLRKNSQSEHMETRRELSVAIHDLDNAERTIANLNTVIDIVKRLIALSADYTHSMKRNTMKLIVDAFNNELSMIETVLYRRDLRQGKFDKSKEYDDIPF